ncbi:leupaxin isoform X2 [Neodiprion pinetum]|uniref:Leupaxin isoform X2 n=1 Tax=Neodiprion lecontei TaxID=441921 RepID=A0ABM3GBU5_NEOLC|nr:leupaxin isoform X2 [Neodiprion fabricii]XP_046485031.1 leupaxin isoform X2 [Neodiprion pinetum]XP_046597737.1 leupaxin isoform X2 [Neodiprion lecontei]
MAMDRSMYGKVEPGATYQPYRITVKNGSSPGYALLADLQNTVSPDGNNATTPGYGSLNGARSHPGNYRGYDNRTSPLPPQSPTYQNREAIEESITRSGNVPHSQTAHGGKMPSLNNNLSELDTLLQDLSNAHYNAHLQERDSIGSTGRLNGGANSPMLRSPSSLSTTRPTVDSLLEELSTAVPAGEYPQDGKVTVTIQETSTEIQPVYEGYAQNQRESLVTRTETNPSLANGHAASNATKELDDLMASLSEFKINGSTHQHQTVTDSPYAKPNKATKSSPSPQPAEGPLTRIHISETHTTHHYQPQHGESHNAQAATQIKQNQLDSMLGNLQADMSRQGVNTTQKGCCNACEKPIVGQVITALGKTWHPEHFTCTHCNQELGTRNFFERDGHPYCEPDYHNLFSPRCAYCNGPILDKCVTALEKTWHTEHFFCAQCGKQFGEDGFHERDGKPYCREDYFDMFAPKCGGCNRAIMENYISALNSQWHPDCFVCRDCRQPFHGGSFFDHEGLPYCETHYHAKRGSLCAGCHKPITGRCITAMFRKFHPEHFVCAFCLKQLNKGTFKEQNDKPYCHGCFDKLFG